MSATTGSLSYQRFFVETKLPRDFVARAHDAIQKQVMRPLTADEPDAERSGWCLMGDAMDLELDRERVFLDGFLNLGLRTDRWAIPAALLKTRLREAEARQRGKKGREKLGKREKAELKEVVTRELRKKLLPSIRVVDLSWSLEDNVIRFFTHNKKASAVLLQLFQKTFGFEPVPESPFTLGRRLGLDAAELAAWEALEPTSLLVEEPVPAAPGGGR